MLIYDSTAVSEEKDVNDGENSCLWMTSHFKYFQDMDFKYETRACNNCHDLMESAVKFGKVVTFPVNGRLQSFSGMRNDEDINNLKNANFTKNVGQNKVEIQNIFFYKKLSRKNPIKFKFEKDPGKVIFQK